MPTCPDQAEATRSKVQILQNQVNGAHLILRKSNVFQFEDSLKIQTVLETTILSLGVGRACVGAG